MLTKKGQERLFVLKSDSIMWFLSKTGAEKVPFAGLPDPMMLPIHLRNWAIESEGQSAAEGRER